MKLQDLLKDIELGKVYTDKDRPPFKVNEDGHTDVASAIRKLKLVCEDSQQILEKLQTMNPEDSLPSWWSDKITIVYDYLNKSRDYLLTNEGKLDEQGPGYSSKEAKVIVDGSLRQYSKQLRKLQYNLVKDWMSKAKSGVVDFFDINRGLQMGDASRAYPYEIQFLMSVLTKDKIIDRFRKYFGGKKGKKGRKK